MLPDRRGLLAMSLALVGAQLSGCARSRTAGPALGPLDPHRLDQGLPELANEARPAILNLGVAAIGAPRAWFADRSGHYPMAGVSKLPIAAAALALVDAGRLHLNERIEITSADLSPPPSRVNGLLMKDQGARGVSLPMADLIALAIQHDDSTASDAVLRRIGGPAAVTSWLAGAGVPDLRIDRYDRERLCDMFDLGPFRPEWAGPEAWEDARESRAPGVRQAAMDAYLADSRDTTTAPAATLLLTKLASGALLGPSSTAFLLRLMADADPVAGLAQGLGGGATAACKAGSTPTNLGFTAADNLLAVVTQRDGSRLVVALFLAGSTATAKARAALFAKVGSLVTSATKSA